MRAMRAKCESGCHGQLGLIIGIFQLECGWDLSALKFGATMQVHRAQLMLSVVVMLGPFQFGGGIRLTTPPEPQS